jgi:ribosomal protein S18 acetylase RimI-like enzyme
MTTETAAPLPAPAADTAAGVTYRLYRGLEELDGMAAANHRLRRHVGLLEPIDLESMTHRYTHLVNSNPLTDCVIAEHDGRTVGYCRVEWHNLTDGDRILDLTALVEPATWGLGVTDAFIAWGEARLAQIAPGIPGERRSWFATYVFDGDDELRDALERHGYVPVRWDAEMLRETMDDLPAIPPLPDGYAIRPMPLESAPAVGGMLIEAFREHWGEHEDGDDEIADWLENPRFDAGLVSVVWHGDEPAAVVSAQVQDHSDGSSIGYVDAVATHPAHRRLGLARAALADNLHRLAARGQTRAYLGVDTDNHNRAFALYETAGFRKVSGSTSYRKPFDRQELTP